MFQFFMNVTAFAVTLMIRLVRGVCEIDGYVKKIESFEITLGIYF